jgi:hypothetical protein
MKTERYILVNIKLLKRIFLLGESMQSLNAPIIIVISVCLSACSFACTSASSPGRKSVKFGMLYEPRDTNQKDPTHTSIFAG